MNKKKQTRKKAESGYSYFNRELSWIEFNSRVLNEGLRTSVPLLERLKFLSIVSSNFDEFFMVRVAGVKHKLRKKKRSDCPSGLTLKQQYSAINSQVSQLVTKQYQCLNNEILPGLKRYGLKIQNANQFLESHNRFLRNYFERNLFALLTPIRLTEPKDLQNAGALRLNLVFQLKKNNEEKPHLAIVRLPSNITRFIPLPISEQGIQYALVEDVVSVFATQLFPGFNIESSAVFRVTRDADLGVDEERDDDFLEALEEVLESRKRSNPVRMEISSGSHQLQTELQHMLGLTEQEVFAIDGPLDLRPFMELTSIKGLEKLMFPPKSPQAPADLVWDADLWDEVRRRNMLVHTPYESFEPLIHVLEEAAVDPDVLAIKMTLYRMGGRARLVRALIQAAENGTHVTVLVEVKARFDEEQNLQWAQELERSGAIVLYGVANLKVHAKMMLIIRKGKNGIERLLHMGTGNYNEKTAKLYGDLGMLTSDEELATEASAIFNYITGYSNVPSLRRLVMAPHALKTQTIQLIERETERSSNFAPGLIMAKMNSLADTDVIQALYAASKAGVRVLLNIRGVCMLVPGVKGQSENIRVVSIVGRYLEHSRIFYFQNRGSEEIFLSSADWMPRNLERRVELMFPVNQSDHKKRIKKILEAYFSDNCQSYELQSNGTWERNAAGPREKTFSSQEFFLKEAIKKKSSKRKSDRMLRVRRKPGDNQSSG